MNPSNQIKLEITQEDLLKHKRLDNFLSDNLSDFSRTLIKKFFEEGSFTSDYKIELKRMPPLGTIIYFNKPEIASTEIIAENIPLDILFEDEYLMIINKPAGLVVHPAPGNYTGTLVNAILFHCHDLTGIGNEKRPGIVHRLDKGTSGVMVVAKEQKTHEGLVNLFSTHSIDRKYEAICLGSRIPSEYRMESLIGRNQNNRLKMTTKVPLGKTAITNMKVIDYFTSFSHIELTLHTGRTHQIRVHMNEILNAPLLNDLTYGREKEEKKIMSTAMKGILAHYEHPFLHAKRLGFIHPITKENLVFETPPPKIFTDILNQLRLER